MSKHPAYELAREVSQGNVPSNEAMKETIESTKQALESEASKRGKGTPEAKIAKDTAQFLGTTEQFVQEKNKGEVVQKFFLDAKQASAELSRELERLNKEGKLTYEGYGISTKVSDWSQVAQNNIDTIKGFVLSLVDSPEFRSLLMEFVSIAQDTIRIESQKAPSMDIPEKSTQPLSQEVREKTAETVEFGKSVTRDIKEGALPISEDRKRELFYRFKFFLKRLSATPEYRKAMNGLFQILDQVYYYTQKYSTEAKEQTLSAEQTQSQLKQQIPHLLSMWNDGVTFLSGFTGREVLDKTMRDFQFAFKTLTNDQRIPTYFSHFRSFIYEMMNNPNLIDKEDFNTRLNDLWEEGRQWTYDPQYNHAYNLLWGDASTIGQRIKSDPLQSRLAKDANTLAQDLILDESGQPSLQIMTTGLNRFRSLVAPILVKNLENLPIPPFSGSDETYDWTIEGMILNGREIIPDNFDVKVWGAANLSLASTAAKALTFVTVWVRDIGVEMKDLKFHFIRKSFPKVDEKGVANVNIQGKGSAIKLVWRIEGQQNQPWLFSLYDVQCHLANLDVTVKESTHTWLMKMITSLWSGTIKRQIEYRIEETMRQNLLPLNERLNEVLRE